MWRVLVVILLLAILAGINYVIIESLWVRHYQHKGQRLASSYWHTLSWSSQ